MREIDWDRHPARVLVSHSATPWYPIPGHPDYAVNEAGEVLSIRRGSILMPWLNNMGYPTIRLYPARRNRLVHKLVALVFYGPCPEGQEVRHLDGDRTNPSAANLAYGTRRQNIEDMRAHGTHPSQRTPQSECSKGHTTTGRCDECHYAAKRAWVRKNVGTYAECDNCGRTVSVLNMTRHKKSARCQKGK